MLRLCFDKGGRDKERERDSVRETDKHKQKQRSRERERRKRTQTYAKREKATATLFAADQTHKLLVWIVPGRSKKIPRQNLLFPWAFYTHSESEAKVLW